jgi:hypothetical protein
MATARKLAGSSPASAGFSFPSTVSRKKNTGMKRSSPRSRLSAWLGPRENGEGLPRRGTRSATPRSELQRIRRLGLGFTTWMQRGSRGVYLGLYRGLICTKGKRIPLFPGLSRPVCESGSTTNRGRGRALSRRPHLS